MRNAYTDGKPIFDRRHGPASEAAGDGQEGIYTGVLHTAPSNGFCKVVIPALGLTSYRTANVPPYITGSAGDTCLVAFDEEKLAWVIHAQTLLLTDVEVITALGWTGPTWATPTLTNSWANVGGGFETAAYLKDPLGFVHLKGVVSGGASGTSAFTLPAGFRPGALTFNSAGGAGPSASAVQIFSVGAVACFPTAGQTQVGLSGITFLAEN